MAKILCIGDSPTLHSGFARVMREIINGLVNAGHEVKVIGWVYQGETHNFPYQIISPIDLQNDYYGIQQTSMIIDMWEPDILFSIGDIHMIDWIPKLENRKKVKWIAYFPIDGSPLPKKWIPIIKDMDVPIAYSKFAYDLINDAIPDVNIKVIYHGVDTETFYPLSEEEIDNFKKHIFQDYDNQKNKWIVGCFARNQWRKNLPALFKAFEEFSKDKNDVLLYYHGAVKDVGWDIDELIDKHNLIGKVMVLSGITPNQGVSNKTLNHLYNMCDIGVLPTLAEGYGLPVAEQQSCGKPVLVTDFSTCAELVQSNDERIKVACMYTPPSKEKGVVIDYALIDTNDLVNKLNKFYYNRELEKQLGLQGREWALKNQWADKVKEFVDLFEEITNEYI